MDEYREGVLHMHCSNLRGSFRIIGGVAPSPDSDPSLPSRDRIQGRARDAEPELPTSSRSSPLVCARGLSGGVSCSGNARTTGPCEGFPALLHHVALEARDSGQNLPALLRRDLEFVQAGGEFLDGRPPFLLVDRDARIRQLHDMPQVDARAPRHRAELIYGELIV